MKVVLFCGGLGTRMRDYAPALPKPMVPLGARPILWHVMKYYAFYGHTDFILCLGYKADLIKEYFLNYNECVSNDFVLSDGGRRVELLGKDIQDWRITFVDTGLTASIGERLKAVEPHLRGEEAFLANYSDGLTDCPLPRIIERFRKKGSVATLLAVHPNYSFHVAQVSDDDMIDGVADVRDAGIWINGGFFVFRRQIFDFLRENEDLPTGAFARLIERRQLSAYRWEGFWRGIDTFKDLQEMETCMTERGGPWEVWRNARLDGGETLPPGFVRPAAGDEAPH